jgi:hypothetical protein
LPATASFRQFTANAAQQNNKTHYEHKTKTNPRHRGAGGNAAPADPPTFRTNPEVDAKIDAYIKENPKYWTYLQAMPRDRLERTVVLNEVRELDRQQRMREGVMKRINANPELKRAYETLVKDLPEDQKEGVIAQIGRTARAGRRPRARPAASLRGVLSSVLSFSVSSSSPGCSCAVAGCR